MPTYCQYMFSSTVVSMSNIKCKNKLLLISMNFQNKDFVIFLFSAAGNQVGKV